MRALGEKWLIWWRRITDWLEERDLHTAMSEIGVLLFKDFNK
jgi:hypothetical protein